MSSQISVWTNLNHYLKWYHIQIPRQNIFIKGKTFLLKYDITLEYKILFTIWWLSMYFLYHSTSLLFASRVDFQRFIFTQEILCLFNEDLIRKQHNRLLLEYKKLFEYCRRGRGGELDVVVSKESPIKLHFGLEDKCLVMKLDILIIAKIEIFTLMLLCCGDTLP